MATPGIIRKEALPQAPHPRPFHPPRRNITPTAERLSSKHAPLELWSKELKDADIFEGDVAPVLYNIFPGTVDVAHMGNFRSHILFVVRELPPAPWPLTVGGLPITIVDDDERGRVLLFPRQNTGNLSRSICREGFDTEGLPSDDDLCKLAVRVSSEVQRVVPSLRILELMFTTERTFYVVLENRIQIRNIESMLPGSIANCLVGYLNDEDMRRPRWAADLQAKRPIEPPYPVFGRSIDDTAYDTLRPGVMICSRNPSYHRHVNTVPTTAGILVENGVGDRFMTAASHGIGPHGTVALPSPPGEVDGKAIGKAAVEIPDTGVGLVELEKDVEFLNETFEDSVGGVPAFSHMVTSQEKPKGRFSCLNSPYTGNLEGTIVMKSARLRSTSTPKGRLPYVAYLWSYCGQEEDNEDKVRPTDGSCGSAIWDENSIVRGFYHYHVAEGLWAGFSAAVSASEVVDAGYRLVS
ncbi:hypothetical protein C8A00DRAFT_35209 [Chaetomidium leptoderma]|uniref:Uncharacterized protein n=1 Tax=Chaetomidium leptoderma TaxID=669021 RepID=A0AAN6VIE1_9PEZI|nr:hypothetical protein C8A00DRAFT_35209 [Chaetomidium leptoderma]